MQIFTGEAVKRRASSLTQQAYELLRERIITGDLPPGRDVSEPELAEQLQMSKTPVREALSRLCIEGFMEAFPRRGYRVTPVTVKDVNDLFAVRAVLEGMAASAAAVNLTESELDELERLAKASYVIGEDRSTKAFVASNEKFHTAIAQGARNPRLLALVKSHIEESDRLFYLGTRSRDINPETNSDHSRIVDALRKRDPELARQTMISHIENTRQGLLSTLLSASEASVSI
ncbi:MULTISPECIES: GntR family transcriptional regulator [unclassified Klebsiella]|uniref:GntR family transcriptional regulator n=1 Tax=unclassified Klebsiella TaxID=2608929 RepID=UPI000C2B3B1F|nr:MULTISPECIES: GntR family transcriptional regulator [unclassified Klebsiella]PJX55969.1 GntR family transcriptional regulator [Klebsiella sp. F-Nf9]PKJ69886.1 GntR family transcriptional regulator [Klebsiella sp. X1-16S-Nf21]